MLTVPMLVSMFSAAALPAQTPRTAVPPPPIEQQEVAAGLLKAPADDTIAFRNSIYDTAGRVTSSLAASNGGTFELYLWRRTSFCDNAGASDGPPAEAAYGWRVAVRTVGFKSVGSGGQPGAMVYTEVTINLEWQRRWEGGHPVNGPAGTMLLTLHPGDRVPLDTIVAPTDAASCAASSMTLAVEPFPAQAAARPLVARRSVTGGMARGTVTVAKPARAGTAASRSSAGLSSGVYKRDGCVPADIARSGRSSVVMADASGCAAASSDLEPALLRSVNVDLWLVHHSSSGATEQNYRRVTTTPADGRFAFPPVAFETSFGERTLEVMGFAQAQRAAGGTETFEIGFARRTSMVAAGGFGMSVGVGAGSRTIDMPKAGEVVSIELPPVQGALPGDQFSLRVRVAQ